MDTLIAILAGFGLAAPAGLNAWLPLLIVGLAARFTDLIQLNAPYNALENEWVLLVLAILLGIEIFADKIPVVDSVNDVIHTFIRPTAGAILFAANADAVSSMNPVLALILGLLAAGGVHAIKASVRPVITASTAGIANPFVSILEDLLAAITVIIALLVPVLSVIILIVGIFFALRVVERWRKRRATQAAAGRR
jgi:hypothetical protein